MNKLLFLASFFFTTCILTVQTKEEKKALCHQRYLKNRKVPTRVMYTHHPELQDLHQNMINTPEYKAYKEAQVAYRTKIHLDHEKFQAQHYYQACKKQVLAYQKTKEYKLYQRMKREVQSHEERNTIYI